MNITINDVGFIQYLYRPKTVEYYNTKSIEINPLQYHPVLFKIWMKKTCATIEWKNYLQAVVSCNNYKEGNHLVSLNKYMWMIRRVFDFINLRIIDIHKDQEVFLNAPWGNCWIYLN